MKRTLANVLTAAVLVPAVPACALAHDIDALAFLAGQWQEKTDQSLTEETWLGPRGDMMIAANLSTRNGRTGFETLRIVRRDATLVLLASPDGRHPPTDFPLKELRDGEVVFENAAIAFPRRIVYRRAGEALVARIEGTVNGQERSREWTFRRVAR